MPCTANLMYFSSVRDTMVEGRLCFPYLETSGKNFLIGMLVHREVFSLQVNFGFSLLDSD